MPEYVNTATQLSDWNCERCGQPAVEGLDEVPRCQNKACPYYESVVPNYLH